MAIEFRTWHGGVARYDLRNREWSGAPRLLEAIHAYGRREQHASPGAPAIQPDSGNEIWVYLNAYWALIHAGVVFNVVSRPTTRIERVER